MSEGAGGWIARCRDAGVPVWLWGDIPLADAEPLQRLGVEGIMVDDPSAFRKTLSR